METTVKQRHIEYIEHNGIYVLGLYRIGVFCLNHASAHKVTELYIVKDFSKIDTLNQQVIERIINYKTVCKSVLYKGA